MIKPKRSKLKFLTLVTTLLILSTTKQLSQNIDLTWQGHLGERDVFTIDQSEIIPVGTTVNKPEITSSHPSIHINQFQLSTPKPITSDSSSCIKLTHNQVSGEKSTQDFFFGICDSQESVTVFELQQDGALHQAARFAGITGMKVATSVYNSSDTVRIVGFADETKRDNLVVASFKAGQANSQSFVLQGDSMQDGAWTGAEAFKTTDAKVTQDTLIVYEEADSVGYQGSTFVHFLTGEMPNGYISSVDLKTTLTDASSLMQVKVIQTGDVTRIAVVYSKKENIAVSDCKVTKKFSKTDAVTKFDFVVEDCQAVTEEKKAIIGGNGNIVFLDAQKIAIFDFSTKQFQICEYDSKNTKITNCDSSIRQVKIDDELTLTQTQVTAKMQGTEIQISLLNKKTKSHVLTVHNIKKQDFDTYKDITSSSVVAWPENLLSLTSSLSSLRTINNKGIFTIEIYADKEGSQPVQGIVTYSDMIEQKPLNINLKMNYTVANPVKDFKLTDSTVLMPEFDVVSNDSQLLNLDRNNFNGNDLKFNFFAQQNNFDIYSFEDVDVQLTGVEDLKLKNPVLKKLHRPYDSVVIAEYKDDDKKKVLAAGTCVQGDDSHGLKTSCKLVQSQAYNSIVNIFTSNTDQFEGTHFIDLNSDKNILTLISIPNLTTQKISTSVIQLATGENLKTAYFGVHSKDLAKGTGSLNYLVWSTQSKSGWTLNLCWSETQTFDCEKNSSKISAKDSGIQTSLFCPTEVHKVQGIDNQLDLLLNCGAGNEIMIQRVILLSTTKLNLGNSATVNHPLIGSGKTENIKICTNKDEYIIFNPDQGTLYGRSILGAEASGVHDFQLEEYDIGTVDHMVCLPEQRMTLIFGKSLASQSGKLAAIWGNHASDNRNNVFATSIHQDSKSKISGFSSSGINDATVLITVTDSKGDHQTKKGWINGPVVFLRSAKEFEDGSDSIQSHLSVEVKNPKISYTINSNNFNVSLWKPKFDIQAKAKKNITKKEIIDLDQLAIFNGPVFKANISFYNGSMPEQVKFSSRMTNYEIKLKDEKQIRTQSEVNLQTVNSIHYLKPGYYIDFNRGGKTGDLFGVTIYIMTFSNTTRAVESSIQISSKCTDSTFQNYADGGKAFIALYCQKGSSYSVEWMTYDYKGKKFSDINVISNFQFSERFESVQHSDKYVVLATNSRVSQNTRLTVFDLDDMVTWNLKSLEFTGAFGMGKPSKETAIVISTSYDTKSRTSRIVGWLVNEKVNLQKFNSDEQKGYRADEIACTVDEKIFDTICVFNDNTRNIKTFKVSYNDKTHTLDFSDIRERGIFERYHPVKFDLTPEMLLVKSRRGDYSKTIDNHILSFYSLDDSSRYINWGITDKELTPELSDSSYFLYTDTETGKPIVVVGAEDSVKRRKDTLNMYEYNDLMVEFVGDLDTQQQGDLYFKVSSPVGGNSSVHLMKFFDPDFKTFKPDPTFIWDVIGLGIIVLVAGFILYHILRFFRNRKLASRAVGVEDDYEAFVSKDIKKVKNVRDDEA